MSERFLKREEMRQTVNKLKKKEKEFNEIDCENSDFIMKAINDLKVNIESKLQLLDSNVNKSKLQEDIQEINDEYEKLNKYINDSTLYLAKYNLKSAQLILSSLRTKIDIKKDSLIPKSKFSFKSVVTKPTTDVSLKSKCDSNDVTDSESPNSKSCKSFNAESIPLVGFKNVSNSETPLKMLAEDTYAKDLELNTLENCIIEIYGAPNTLHINNLLNCKVFCGPITTSIFIANSHNCVFNIACQQLRVHTSSDCDIYLHVTSRAIIEESKRLRFAPYSWSYDNILEDFKIADLDHSINNWQQIDDFDCLSTDGLSPNWSFIAL